MVGLSTFLLWKLLVILRRHINHLCVKKSSLSTEVKTPFGGTSRSIREFHRLGAKLWRRTVADKVSTTRMMDRTGMHMEQTQKLLATWCSSHRTGASRPVSPSTFLSTNIQAFCKNQTLAVLFICYKEPALLQEYLKTSVKNNPDNS